MVNHHLSNFLIIKNINFDELKMKNEIDKMKTLNEKYNLLHENIIYVFDKNAPIYEILSWNQSNKRKPWTTNG